VSVLPGDGSGGFGAAIASPTPVSFVPYAVAADFDGDGIDDLGMATTEEPSKTPYASILIADGTGRFGAAFSVTTSAGAWFAIAEDLGADGCLDLVVGSVGDGLQLFRGDGAGRIAPWGRVLAGETTIGTAGADFDADGQADLAACAAGTVAVLLGDGRGGFFPAARFPGG